MTDIALRWIDSTADLDLQLGDLLLDEGLQTAVILSLFCDARAEDSDVLPEGETQRRGWWGDQFGLPADRTGSKLWMLWREKRVPATLQRAQRYCEQALQWLVDDGVADSVVIACEFVSMADLTHSGVNPHEFALVIDAQINKPDGVEHFRFARQWQAQFDKVA